MKKFIAIFYFLTFAFNVNYCYAQKYKNAEDTVKLNKEILNVSNEIVALTAKLTVAENDLPGLQAKVNDANSNAANAANESSNQASKATNGNVRDARNAKRKASKAYGEAKDYKAAKDKLNKQEDKINKYKSSLNKYEQRMRDLDIMKAAINAKIIASNSPSMN